MKEKKGPWGLAGLLLTGKARGCKRSLRFNRCAGVAVCVCVWWGGGGVPDASHWGRGITEDGVSTNSQITEISSGDAPPPLPLCAPLPIVWRACEVYVCTCLCNVTPYITHNKRLTQGIFNKADAIRWAGVKAPFCHYVL